MTSHAASDSSIATLIMNWAHPFRSISFWKIGLIIFGLIILAPLFAIFRLLNVSSENLWTHLFDTVLVEYISNTLILSLGVGIVTTILGTSCAWFVTMYQFPGRRILTWMLVLPLAMPAYVLAYAYTDLLQFTGPLQTMLRELTGWKWGDYWFPNIRSLGGATFVLSSVLYPYVYVTARAAFIEQSVCVLEVSRTLGCSPFSMFIKIALPLGRPAIISGVAFVMMETLADFGAVKFFEVNTFTTGIYRAWFADGNPAAAAQLSVALLSFIFLILTLERLNRGTAGYMHTSGRYRPIRPLILSRIQATGISVYCLFLICAGFVLPSLGLLYMALIGADQISLSHLAELAWHTLIIGLSASLLTVSIASLIIFTIRRRKSLVIFIPRLANLGYAMPGVVIAIGVLGALSNFDRFLNILFIDLSGAEISFTLNGTIAAILYGCLIRFFAVAYGPLESGLQRIRSSLEDAAHTLGSRSKSLFKDLYFPLMRGSILSAGLLVFVDVMKELPATMILRPFNFDTLAIETFRLATTERLDSAAIPSLIIVGISLIPVILLCRAIARARPGHAVET